MITVIEKLNSRTGTDGPNATAQWKFLLRGSDDELALRQAIRASVPSSFIAAGIPNNQVFTLDNVSLDEQHGTELWSGSANYKLADQADKQTGEMTFSFDTTGGTQHITQSIATSSWYMRQGKGAGASPFKGAIGVTNSSVEGVDITIPTYAFSETHYLPDSVVTDAYKGLLFSLTGRISNAAFKGGKAGEVLFLGATGSKRGLGDWEVTFKFAASPDVTIAAIGDINNIEKKGWDYLWVRYVTTEAGTDPNKIITQTPQYVICEQVYYTGDLSKLGIGI